MNFGIVLCTLFLVIIGIALNANTASLVELLWLNVQLQVALFILVACIPYLKTGRMSYVDIAWPFGVALIGAQIIVFADGDLLRRLLVGGIYLFIGLRMGLGALVMGLKSGVIFKTEFPRYQYRRMVFERSGTQYMRGHILAEIMAQGLANASVLALPGFLMAVNPDEQLSVWEVAGMGLWVLAYVCESIADTQKLLFIAKHPKGVCNVGLWRYSRHPNYFAEWLVWSALVVACVPSWMAQQGQESLLVWLMLGIGALFASIMLYITLVYLTGAKPAEYYSVRKRPEYRAYQKATSMFFPWFPKKVEARQ